MKEDFSVNKEKSWQHVAKPIHTHKQPVMLDVCVQFTFTQRSRGSVMYIVNHLPGYLYRKKANLREESWKNNSSSNSVIHSLSSYHLAFLLFVILASGSVFVHNTLKVCVKCF